MNEFKACLITSMAVDPPSNISDNNSSNNNNNNSSSNNIPMTVDRHDPLQDQVEIATNHGQTGQHGIQTHLRPSIPQRTDHHLPTWTILVTVEDRITLHQDHLLNCVKCCWPANQEDPGQRVVRRPANAAVAATPLSIVVSTTPTTCIRSSRQTFTKDLQLTWSTYFRSLAAS